MVEWRSWVKQQERKKEVNRTKGYLVFGYLIPVFPFVRFIIHLLSNVYTKKEIKKEN